MIRLDSNIACILFLKKVRPDENLDGAEALGRVQVVAENGLRPR